MLYLTSSVDSVSGLQLMYNPYIFMSISINKLVAIIVCCTIRSFSINLIVCTVFLRFENFLIKV